MQGKQKKRNYKFYVFKVLNVSSINCKESFLSCLYLYHCVIKNCYFLIAIDINQLIKSQFASVIGDIITIFIKVNKASTIG